MASCSKLFSKNLGCMLQSCPVKNLQFDAGVEPALQNLKNVKNCSVLSTSLLIYSHLWRFGNLSGTLHLLAPRRILAPRASGASATRANPAEHLPYQICAAVSAVAVLKVGTSHTRPVRRSMCTCRKSWPERATGNSRKSGLIHPPRRVGTSRSHATRGNDEAGLDASLPSTQVTLDRGEEAKRA